MSDRKIQTEKQKVTIIVVNVEGKNKKIAIHVDQVSINYHLLVRLIIQNIEIKLHNAVTIPSSTYLGQLD